MSKQKRNSIALIAEKWVSLDTNDELNIREMSIESGAPESLVAHNYKMDLAIGWIIDSQRDIEQMCEEITR
jgi:hypothetical protein